MFRHLDPHVFHLGREASAATGSWACLRWPTSSGRKPIKQRKPKKRRRSSEKLKKSVGPQTREIENELSRRNLRRPFSKFHFRRSSLTLNGHEEGSTLKTFGPTNQSG